MNKYLQILKVTLQEYFVYRLNFVLWRLRTVLQLLVLYFFWQAALPSGRIILGYDQSKILTYILGTSIIRSFVLASRSVDIGGEIASGSLGNFLTKPIGYLKYWFIKDLSDKVVNLVFSIFELIFIFLILRPPIIIQTDWRFLVLSVIAVIFGILLYFYLSFLLSLVAFWMPENPWPPRFLFIIILEFAAGGLFPLDILPKEVFYVLKILPFPYLLFFPLDVYLGKVSFSEIFIGLGICIFWISFLYQISVWIFRLGLKNYAAWGR